MRIGYQGVEKSYSHQVCEKFIDLNKISSENLLGFQSFELVFRGLLFNLIDCAILPIENSLGGCIFINYDLFYKYGIKIHAEFHHNIEHSLYSTTDDISKIKKILSHPQALQQCKENLRKKNFEVEEYWDTTASISRLLELNDETLGCLSPPNLSNEFNLFELEKKVNDHDNNITRFYLISLKDKKLNLPNILKPNLKLNEDKKITLQSIQKIVSQSNNVSKDYIYDVVDKFSGYAIIKDEIGSLQSYLSLFKENNINLTKLESRPYLGKDRNLFSYIFYIEGIYNLGFDKTKDLEKILYNSKNSFNYFGNFSIKDIKNSNELKKEQSNDANASKSQNNITMFNSSELNFKKYSPLNIGIVGFGRFGRFIGQKMVDYGFNVFCTSRTDYSEIAEPLNIKYLSHEEFEKKSLEENSIDVLLFSISINSFEKVLKSFNKDVYKNKLLVEVLSVKEYPFNIVNNLKEDYFSESLALFTHPMFGPDSASMSWVGKKFVYWHDLIQEGDKLFKFNTKLNLFLKFWEDNGCNMLKIEPYEHDYLSANSQFLSHLIGRLLEIIDCNETIIDTDLYSFLIKVKEHVTNDSWDLFYGLYKYNSKSIETIKNLKKSLNNLINRLENMEETKGSIECIAFDLGSESHGFVAESETGKVFSIIKDLREKGEKVLNFAIGEPTWCPNKYTDYSCNYSTSKGENYLIDKIIFDYKNKNKLKEKNTLQRENIMITSGAKFGLYLILKQLTKEGTSWLIPKPYWVSYPDMIKSLNGESIFINSSVDNNWVPNINTIENECNNDFLNGIILSNPNNPTGLTYPEYFIDEILRIVNINKIYLIVDEVYLLINEKIKSMYDRNNKFIIVVSSFSKYYGCPGWRIGYIFANNELISKLVKLQSTILGCASMAGQEFCGKLINQSYTPNLSFLNKSKSKLQEMFISIGWKIVNNSESSMYIFPYNKERSNIELLIDRLKSKNIFIMDGKAFGIDNAIRITIPTTEDELSILVENISGLLCNIDSDQLN